MTLPDSMAELSQTRPLLNTLLEPTTDQMALSMPILATLGGKLQDLYQPALAEAAPDHLAALLQQLIAVLPDSAPHE